MLVSKSVKKTGPTAKASKKPYKTAYNRPSNILVKVLITFFLQCGFY